MPDSALLYAPAFRLSTTASELWVTWIFGVGLLLVVFACALQAWRAWSHALQLRAEVWRQKGLRSGMMLISGVAEPVEEERDAATREAAAFAPFVELTIHQEGTQHSSRNGQYVMWLESSRSLSERPFILHTDEGTRIRVEPSGQIELIDKLEEPMRAGNTRRRVARIIPGERIWVRGQLVIDSAQGPYRGLASQPTLRPSPDRPLLICSQPIEAEDRSATRLHAGFAVGMLLMLLFCQRVVFGEFHALRHGVEQTATLVSKRYWSTRNKNSVTMHFAYTLAPTNVEDEVSNDAYTRGEPGDLVPIVRGAKDATVFQIGPRSEVGIDTRNVVAAGLVCAGIVVAWLAVAARRKPWWRRPRYDERTPGTL